MRFSILLCLVFFHTLSLAAQHFLTFGSGYSSIIFNSGELDQLGKTYNYGNSPNLSRLMSGFNSGDGVRLEAGYRYMQRWNTAITLGYQFYSSFDGAAFNNGQARNLDLKIHQFVTDFELGWKR